jgi:hypothetical protein
MAVTSMFYNWMWAYGGDNGYSVSVQVGFSPAFGVAQVSLSAANGDGLCSAGVSEYEIRPDPNGPNQPITFGWDTNFGFPPAVYDPSLTSVTATMEVGGNGQNGTATLMTWQFS